MYQEVKNTLLTALLAAGSIAMQATDLHVDSLRITSPYCMNTPIRTDSTDVWGKAFQQEDLMMDAPMQLNQWLKGECMADSIVPASEKGGVRLAGGEQHVCQVPVEHHQHSPAQDLHRRKGISRRRRATDVARQA